MMHQRLQLPLRPAACCRLLVVGPPAAAPAGCCGVHSAAHPACAAAWLVDLHAAAAAAAAPACYRSLALAAPAHQAAPAATGAPPPVGPRRCRSAGRNWAGKRGVTPSSKLSAATRYARDTHKTDGCAHTCRYTASTMPLPASSLRRRRRRSSCCRCCSSGRYGLKATAMGSPSWRSRGSPAARSRACRGGGYGAALGP